MGIRLADKIKPKKRIIVSWKVTGWDYACVQSWFCRLWLVSGKGLFILANGPTLRSWKLKQVNWGGFDRRKVSQCCIGVIGIRQKKSLLAKPTRKKWESVYQLGINKPGVNQTACNREPYFFTRRLISGMELGSAAFYQRERGIKNIYPGSLNTDQKRKATLDGRRYGKPLPGIRFTIWDILNWHSDCSKAQLVVGYYETTWRQKVKNNAFYQTLVYMVS